MRAGIVIALVITLPMLGLRGVAHAADLGEDSSSTAKTPDQADDADKPKDPSLLDKNAADAAVAKQKQQQAPVGPPFYEKWQFWALTVAVVVAGVGLFFGTRAILHGATGGDVRPCNPMFLGCGGEGR